MEKKRKSSSSPPSASSAPMVKKKKSPSLPSVKNNSTSPSSSPQSSYYYSVSGSYGSDTSTADKLADRFAPAAADSFVSTSRPSPPLKSKASNSVGARIARIAADLKAKREAVDAAKDSMFAANDAKVRYKANFKYSMAIPAAHRAFTVLMAAKHASLGNVARATELLDQDKIDNLLDLNLDSDRKNYWLPSNSSLSYSSQSSCNV